MEPQLCKFSDFCKYWRGTHFVQFLMALRSNFEHIRGLLVHGSPLPTVDAVLSELLSKEQTQNYLHKRKQTVSENVIFANSGLPILPLVGDVCKYYEQKGHWKRDCSI